jgi:hypothetical protein
MDKDYKNMLLFTTVFSSIMGGIVGAAEHEYKKEADEFSTELKQQNPNAKVDLEFREDVQHVVSNAADVKFDVDKPTDSLAIKQIKEKYLFQMTQYEQMLNSVIVKQQKADAALLSAAREGDLTKVQEALEVMGANVNAQDAKTGNTAIMIAKEKLPFGKAFPIAKYLVAEPGFDPDVENKDGITFMDMMDAELSKGSAAWQSISRKSDMLKPDATRNRDNTEMVKAVVPLQAAYDSLMATYGKEMKAALGYHNSGWIVRGNRSNGRYSNKTVINEDGSTKQYEVHRREATVYPEFARKPREKVQDVMQSDKTGTLEFEKLNPQNIDFKALAHELTMEKMSVQPENVQDAQQNVETTRNYNHGSIDAKTYMKVRGRRGSFSTVEIKAHIEGNKVR